MKITVKAKVTDDSKNKLGKIESEFQNYHYISNQDVQQ
jgi:hypothetical protein